MSAEQAMVLAAVLVVIALVWVLLGPAEDWL